MSFAREMSPIPSRSFLASAWWCHARYWLLTSLLLLSNPAALAQLSVSSSFSQSNIAAGQGSALTLSLRNSGSSPLALPAFALDPIGADAASSSTLLVQTSAVVGGSTVSLGTNCPAAVVTRINGNQGVQLSATRLAAGASCTISVPFSGSIGVAQNKVVTITPKAASVSSGSAAASVTFTARNSVSLWNNFQLTKASSPKFVAPGDPVFFEILINNFAGQTLNGLMVNDRLQSNSAMVSLPGWSGSTGLPAWRSINTSQPATLGGCTVAGVAGSSSNPVFTLDNVLLNGVCTLGFWAALPKEAVENATPINSLELGAVSWVNPATGFTVANASQTSTQMQVIAPLAISAAFSVASSPEGVPVTLSFTLANRSAGTVGNLAFSATLPLTPLGKQLRVASPANAASTCSAGSVTAVAGSNTIALSGASLGPRTINPNIAGRNQASTCTVSVQVIGPADTYTLALPRQALSGSGNYAIDGSAYTPRSSALSAPAPATLVYNTPILDATKAFAPASIGDGGRSTVTVSLNNTGAGALASLALNDPLPPYMTVASPANASSTCSGASVTAVPGAASVTMSGGNLPASSSCQLVFDVIGSGAAPWVNSIPAGAITASGGVQNLAPVSATLANSSPPAVVVSATLAPATLVMPGQDSVLTILLQNRSPLALSNLRLSDYFTVNGTAAAASTGMQLMAPFNLSSSCSGAVLNAASDGGSFSMTGASLPFGASCTITAHVTTSRSGTVVNVIPVQAVASGEGVSNPTGASASLTAGGRIDVSKSFTPALVQPGAVSRLRLNLSHMMPVALGSLALTDHLPPGLVVATPANALTTCSGGSLTASAAQVRLAGASMAPATGAPSACSIELDVVASSEGRYQNTLQVGEVTGTVDGGPASNWVAASATLTVLQAPTLTKQFSAPQIRAGGVSTLILALGNDNRRAMTLAAELLDALPSGMAVAASPNLGGSCDLAQVSAAAGATVVRYASGAVLPAGGCTIRVDVTAAAEGNYSNVIAAGALLTAAGSNRQPATASLTANPLGVISGKVFRDAASAPNGLYDGSKPGVAGVVVALTGTSYGADGVPGGGDDVAVNMQATTDAGGSYGFGGLAAGQYTVSLAVHPPNTVTGITSAGPVQGGGSSGSASAVTAWPSNISGIVILGDDSGRTASSVGNNFAVLAQASVMGRVFADHNNNGVLNGGETGIANVTVQLAGADWQGNAVARSTHSAGDGRYLFDQLPPSGAAGYTLSEIQPARYFDGRTTVPGSQPGVAGSTKPVAAGAADTISGIVVRAGDLLADYNFAELARLVLQLPIVSGYVYLKADQGGTRASDKVSAGMAGWTVQLSHHGALVCRVHSNAQGFYQFDNLHCPGYEESGLPTGSGFAITFLSGGRVVSTMASSGNHRGDVSALGRITGITLSPDERVVEQNLPLDPSGVVYDAQTRQPVAGATVTLSGPAGFDPARHLVGGQASQVTGVNGFYQFLLLGGFPPGRYRLAVLGPPSYQQGAAASMPPCQAELTVAALPDPARVQASNGAPDVTVPVANPAACVGIVAGGAASTQYYLDFVLAASSAPVLNNHLPLDRAATGLLTVFKSTPMMRAARGDLVPYSITVINNQAHPVGAVNLLDQMPPGFKYRRGSASLDHVPLEPLMNGRVMVWRGQNFQANEKKTYRLILVVGAGVEPGDYLNQAWAISVDHRMLSGVAQASTRVVAEPTLDCPDLVGKVFEDRNGNGYQDPGEPGLAGVRLVTPRGVLIHSDAQGRFHVPCPELPNPDRGSNVVLKLDTRTLPEGYRLSTDNPASVRLTRGKVSKISFGAVRYRILRLNLGDAAFVPGLSDLLPQWDAQLDALVERLLEAPSIMRLHYTPLQAAQPPGLDVLRLETLRERLLARWQARQGPYLLRIEIAAQR